MKFLITGGSGFIGSHLADKLISRGDEVISIDNYSTGRRDNLTPNKNLNIVEDNICNEVLINDVMKKFKPDVVVHTAASYKDPNDWNEDIKTNIYGTSNICKSMQTYSIPRIIYLQTALCYGLKPIENPITLNHPILPRGSSYAITKSAGEDIIMLSNLDFLIFRLANAYGPRNISGPLPTFYKRLTEKKECFVMDTRRDFVYVDDLIDCIIKGIDSKAKGAYHISSGSDHSIKELFENTLQALKINVPVSVKPRLPDDTYSILLDPSKTIKDLKWKPTIKIKEGVRRTIDYYKDFGIEETFTHLKKFD